MILYRYLSKEVAKSFLVVFVVLFSIILSTQIIKTLTAINKGQVSLDYLLTLIVFTNVSSLILIIPFVMFLAIILSLSRLYSLSEIVAINSCGFGPSFFYKGLLPLMLLILIVELYLVVWTTPYAKNYLEQIKHVVANKMSIDLLEGGKFNLFSKDSQVIYVDEFKDKKNLAGIYIRIKSKQHQYIITAKNGFLKDKFEDGTRYLILKNGFRYDVPNDGSDFKKISFQEYGILVKPQAWKIIKTDEDTETFMQLWEKRHQPIIQAELQWRVSMILSVFVLYLIAIPLAKIEPRKGPYSKILPAIILYFMYYSLLKASINWVSQEKIPFWLGLWWVHGSFILGAIILSTYKFGWLAKRIN